LAEIEAQVNQTIEEDQESLEEELAIAALLALLLGGRVASRILGIEFQDVSEIEEIIRRNVEAVVEAITQTTREDIAELLRRAQKEGWAITRLRDEMRALFNRYIDDRADLIAITESTWSINIGAALAFEQAGYRRMRWVAVDDDRTCPFCRVMDGRIVEIGKPFASIGDKIVGQDENGNSRTMEVGLRDVLTPPLHPRCRCILIPVD